MVLGTGVDNFVTVSITLGKDYQSINMELICTISRSSIKINCVEKGEAALILFSNNGKNYAIKNIDSYACLSCESRLEDDKFLCEIALNFEIESEKNFPLSLKGGRINQTEKFRSGILQFNDELYSFNIDDPLFFEK